MGPQRQSFICDDAKEFITDYKLTRGTLGILNRWRSAGTFFFFCEIAQLGQNSVKTAETAHYSK